MKTETIFLIVDLLFFIIFLFLIIRKFNKEKKLINAIDHFNTKSASGLIVDEEFIDTINFSQDYSKSLKLHNALQKDEEFYRIEVARILALELIKNKAVDIEFIQGLEVDTIKGKIKYVCKV